MKQFIAIAALACLPLSAQAEGKSCDELKGEIQAKLEAKGVSHFTLEIVSKDAETAGKVVGSCEAGSKKIIYTRG